jgi:hypothetical protein
MLISLLVVASVIALMERLAPLRLRPQPFFRNYFVTDIFYRNNLHHLGPAQRYVGSDTLCRRVRVGKRRGGLPAELVAPIFSTAEA